MKASVLHRCLSDRRLGAAPERDDGDLAAGARPVDGEAWIRRHHSVVQRGAFLLLGYTGPGGEALAAGLDARVRIGGDVQVPRGVGRSWP